MSVLIEEGGPTHELGDADQTRLMAQLIAKLECPPTRVLLIPPDHTRINSGAGRLTNILYHLLTPTAAVDIMPALGTHTPMNAAQLERMFGDIPKDVFLAHDFRKDLVRLGEVPAEMVREWSGGRVDYAVPIEVNKRLTDGGYDLILSIGQIVPHEVIGMANYTKNICIGVGGAETINKSHFLGAAYGMEQIMGRTDTPVRAVLDWGFEQFLSHLPLHFVMTVMERDEHSDGMIMRGMFAGDERCSFESACALSREANLVKLPKPLTKVVVHLEPEEFKSTWLGNKSVYRTRMAIADDGDLIVLAPGLQEFGEDPEIDRLIRKYGYHGTDKTLAAVKDEADLRDNLSAAAHLIHGASEGRFKVTYCPGPKMSRAEIEAVGYQSADLTEMLGQYPPEELQDGFNQLPTGEEIFFISNPGLGLWACDAVSGPIN